jgi:glycosyltransferase involved in cell wall biosynthesis
VHGRKYLLIHRSNGLETHHDLLLSKWLGSPLPDGTPRRWYHINRALFMRIAYSKVDAIVTVSEYDRRFAISERYQPEERIVAINNPIDDLFFCSHVQFERPPCVGFCGAWMPNKGIGVIMYDIPRILREFRGCRFKIIGVGQKFCKDRYFPSDVLEQIDVVPYLFSKADLISEYKSLSILIMPSIYESFGLAAAEAMACGCAVVRSRTGFGVELSDREDALLIDPASPCLYNAVRFLLTDEPMRLKIAKSGYRRVQGLRWKFALDKIEHCYSIWLERHRGI